MTRFIFIFIFLCIFSAGCSKKEKQVPVPPSVTVVPAVMGNVVSATEIIGQAKAYDEVDLVARVQGFLTKINFQEGTTVTKGQLLFQIEKDQYQALVESAQAMLMKAQAVFDNAEITYNRQKKLFEENATAKKNLDDAISAHTEAKANVMQAEADLTTAKLNLGYTTINAPFDGRIGFYTYSEGNLVGLSSKRLANVVKLDPMRVQFNISEVDLVDLRLNRGKENVETKSEYVVTVQFQNGALYSREGKLSFADNKVNSSTGTILVEALFPNPDQVLVPGMYVKVAVKDKEQKPALLIPQSSIQESQLGKFVLVVGADNNVLQRVIKTGIKSGPSIQVVEGLKEGERVVVEGLQKVRLGMPVKPLVDESYSFNSPESAKKPESKENK